MNIANEILINFDFAEGEVEQLVDVGESCSEIIKSDAIAF